MQKSIREIVEKIESSGHDISKRIIDHKNDIIYILYIKQLTDRVMLSHQVIKPFMDFYSVTRESPVTSEIAVNNILYADECKIENDTDKILDTLIRGMTVILFSRDENFVIVNIKKVEKKNIESPELTFTLRGPRDSFTENLDVNLSLVRYRIKDENLRIETFEVGDRTKTRIAVLYINDIANEKCIKQITERIQGIHVDGILESGQVQKFLLNKQSNLFPQMGLAERSDMAAGALLEGKVIVITEGSGLALIAPKVFSEFLWSCEDNYDNKYTGFTAKLLRIVSIVLMVSLTPLYVAIVSFHNDMLPGEYVFILAKLRAYVPFNGFTEAILIESTIEILREALLRVPKQIGQAIGIVGAIIIGQAAISAQIFSPLILIIASLSLMTSFVAPDYTIINPLRILKFFLLIVSSIFGMVGYTMGITIIITNMISSETFGVPYFAPYAPFNLSDSAKSLFYNTVTAEDRPNFLHTKDKKRK